MNYSRVRERALAMIVARIEEMADVRKVIDALRRRDSSGCSPSASARSSATARVKPRIDMPALVQERVDEVSGAGLGAACREGLVDASSPMSIWTAVIDGRSHMKRELMARARPRERDVARSGG